MADMKTFFKRQKQKKMLGVIDSVKFPNEFPDSVHWLLFIFVTSVW